VSVTRNYEVLKSIKVNDRSLLPKKEKRPSIRTVFETKVSKRNWARTREETAKKNVRDDGGGPDERKLDRWKVGESTRIRGGLGETSGDKRRMGQTKPSGELLPRCR